MTIIRKNPAAVAPPIGGYSHLTIIPRDADILCLSGQIGADLEGNIPESVSEQFRHALRNIVRILDSEGVTPVAIFKINIWFTEELPRDEFVQIWREFHEGNLPSCTLAYVSALVQPALKVEVEAWAAKK